MRDQECFYVLYDATQLTNVLLLGLFLALGGRCAHLPLAHLNRSRSILYHYLRTASTMLGFRFLNTSTTVSVLVSSCWWLALCFGSSLSPHYWSNSKCRVYNSSLLLNSNELPSAPPIRKFNIIEMSQSRLDVWSHYNSPTTRLVSITHVELPHGTTIWTFIMSISFHSRREFLGGMSYTKTSGTRS